MNRTVIMISEFLKEILIIAGIIIAAISFIPKIRHHSIKLFAIVFITSLAIYSNNWGVYFVSVIIIATLMTELEFLQNIAAIIRGNKHYFDYKKTVLLPREVIEQQNNNKPISKQISTKKEKLKQNEIFILEQLALEHIEKKLNSHINRNIKVYRKNLNMVLDGLIDNDKNYPDKVFEVKLIQSNRSLQDLIYSGRNLINMLYLKYANITGKQPEIHLIVIIPDEENFLTTENVIKLHADLYSVDYKVIIHLLTFENIGFNPNDPT